MYPFRPYWYTTSCLPTWCISVRPSVTYYFRLIFLSHLTSQPLDIWYWTSVWGTILRLSFSAKLMYYFLFTYLVHFPSFHPIHIFSVNFSQQLHIMCNFSSLYVISTQLLFHWICRRAGVYFCGPPGHRSPCLVTFFKRKQQNHEIKYLRSYIFFWNNENWYPRN